MKLAKYHGTRKESLVRVPGASAPFWPLQRWQSEIFRLFGDPFGDWLIPEKPLMEDWMPAVNVYEDKDNLVVEAEVPGMKKDDIQIYLSGDNLNITGERREKREEKERDTYRAERSFGHFHRMIPLPVPIKAEAIEAHYRDGVLIVTCPKTDDARRKQVEVKVE
ncbi:MAG TPA: Hsp20/alpha crystallin family protein [Verrucomicrobiae bacterium]